MVLVSDGGRYLAVVEDIRGCCSNKDKRCLQQLWKVLDGYGGEYKQQQ